MSKRKMSLASPLGSNKKPSTGSSGEKSVTQVPPISKDMPHSNDGILSMLLSISLAQGRILKGLMVLQDKIELIAANQETLKKEVASMKEVDPLPETNLENLSWLPSDLEIKEWMNSPMLPPEPLCSQDLACYETPFPSIDQFLDHQLMSGGTTDLQELANQNERMRNSLKRT